MESSEGFDEFMKALGVGAIKRRMAASVTPVNVIDIDENGMAINQSINQLFIHLFT